MYKELYFFEINLIDTIDVCTDIIISLKTVNALQTRRFLQNFRFWLPYNTTQKLLASSSNFILSSNFFVYTQPISTKMRNNLHYGKCCQEVCVDEIDQYCIDYPSTPLEHVLRRISKKHHVSTRQLRRWYYHFLNWGEYQAPD